MVVTALSNRHRSSTTFSAPLTIPRGGKAGAEMIRELGADIGLPVWEVLRSVLAWAGEEHAMRSDVFETSTMLDWERQLLQASWEPELRCGLAVLVGELSSPSHALPETVAHTCICVTEWALERGRVVTALAFAEAAALSWPEQSRFSWVTGSLLRRHGRFREAEQWLRRAAKAAVAAGDAESQIRALNALGNVLRDLGRIPQSRRTLSDALRYARRHKHRRLEGEILHDLFVVSSLGGLAEADEYARSAFEIYREGHPRLPSLACEIASLWLLRGCHLQALTVLKHLPQLIEVPEERIKVWGSLAWAAGMCNDADAYREAADEVWVLLDNPETAAPASALLEVGLGATRMKAWDEAEVALTRAIAIAARNGQSGIVTSAEAMLAASRNQTTPDKARPNTPELRQAQTATALVARILTSLERVPVALAMPSH